MCPFGQKYIFSRFSINEFIECFTGNKPIRGKITDKSTPSLVVALIWSLLAEIRCLLSSSLSNAYPSLENVNDYILYTNLPPAENCLLILFKNSLILINLWRNLLSEQRIVLALIYTDHCAVSINACLMTWLAQICLNYKYHLPSNFQRNWHVLLWHFSCISSWFFCKWNEMNENHFIQSVYPKCFRYFNISNVNTCVHFVLLILKINM